MRNLKIYRSAPTTTIATDLLVSGNLAATGYVTGVSFASTSDGRFKGDIQSLDAAECLQVAEALVPCSYVRTDLGELATNQPLSLIHI